jgi:putative transposase
MLSATPNTGRSATNASTTATATAHTSGTPAGTAELAIPELRQGSYLPHWLMERRRRAEQALISVVATAYLLGVSTRRAEKLTESLGITQLSKSQVSATAKHLDDQVAAFRGRPRAKHPARSSGPTH